MNAVYNRIAALKTLIRRNGHTPSFDQSSPIQQPTRPERSPDESKGFFASTRSISATPGLFGLIGKEYADVANELPHGGALGLQNDMPVLSTFGLRVVDTMLTDPVVGACVEMKKTAALSTPWSWESASDEPDHKEHQEYLTEVFDQLDTGEQDADGVNAGVRNKLRDMASMIEYGFSVTNVVLSILEVGTFKGKLGIADLKTKPPHNFTFDVDDYMNIKPDGIVYSGGLESAHGLHMPLDSFIVCSHNPQFGNPYGFSDLIRVYDRWNSKRWRQKLWDLERHGCGTWIALEDKENLASAQERAAVDSFLAGAQARSALRCSNRFEITAHEPDAGSADMWTAAIDACNIEIARGLLTTDKVGLSAQAASGGAYAMSQTHFDLYLLAVSAVQADLAARMKQLGRKLVAASFGPQDKYPNFVFAPMTKEQKYAWLTNVISAVEKGVLIPDPTVAKKVREALELPEQEGATMLPVPGEEPGAQPNEDDDKDEDYNPDEASEDATEEAIAAAGQYDRVIVLGGPRTGKTTFAVLSAYRHARTKRHADALVGQKDWSSLSEEVAGWIDAPGRWVIEGVSAVRALRKWLLSNPEKPVPAAIVLMDSPKVKRSKGQRAMAKGIATIWASIEDDLEKRGTTILRVKRKTS